MLIIHNLNINMDKPAIINNVILKQGDYKGRRLVFNIISNNKRMTDSEIVAISIKAIKPDETIIYDEVKIENGQFYYDIIEQLVTAIGEIECELEIIGENGETINSPNFYLTVQSTVYDIAELLSENDLRGIQAYVSAAYKVLRQVQQIYNKFGMTYGSFEEIIRELEGTKGNYATFLEDLEKKVAEGYFNGEKGAQGENGADAVVAEGFGIVGFQIQEGHLMCYYFDVAPPPMQIDDNGHLTYILEE